MSTNADQIEFWNTQQGDKWVRLQDSIDAMLRPFGEVAMAKLAPARGEHILDIGCGCGDTSFVLAEAAGPDGAVTGVDISKPMLNRAKARASAIPEYNLTFVEGDAQAHALGTDRYDAVFSRFGVMFFEDPATAFANIAGACKGGARMSFACWRAPRENEWIAVAVDAIRPIVDLPPRPGPDDPGQFSFADQDRVRRLLTEGGWSDIEIEPFDTTITVGATTADAADFMMNMGPAGGATRDADDATKAKVRDALADAFEAHAGPSGVRLGYASWTVGARKA